jgi:protein phosphatase PTC7
VLAVVNNTLYASNLGDSGFFVVRSGKLLLQCPQQQHRFNFPYQLGSLGSMSDKPYQAMVSTSWCRSGTCDDLWWGQRV